VNGDAIIVSPPLTITKREIENLVFLLKETFAAFSSQINAGTVGDG